MLLLLLKNLHQLFWNHDFPSLLIIKNSIPQIYSKPKGEKKEKKNIFQSSNDYKEKYEVLFRRKFKGPDFVLKCAITLKFPILAHLILIPCTNFRDNFSPRNIL